jgi:hypothetical protein
MVCPCECRRHTGQNDRRCCQEARISWRRRCTEPTGCPAQDMRPTCLYSECALRPRVYEVQGKRRHGWDGVLSVVDVRDGQHLACVHVVRERGVADSRHAVADHAHARDCGQVQRQVHCVEQRKRGAERMPNHGYGGGTVLFE